MIGTGAGARAEIDFGLLMRKRGRIHGSTLRARSLEEKARGRCAALGAFMPPSAHVPRAGRGDVPARRGRRTPTSAFAAGDKFGKIVVCP